MSGPAYQPSPLMLAKLDYERGEVLRALDLHLRARDRLDQAAVHLADEMLRAVEVWRSSGLLPVDVPGVRPSPSLREYQRFETAAKALQSAESASGISRWTSPESHERTRCCLRDAITAVIECGWRLARIMNAEAGSRR